MHPQLVIYYNAQNNYTMGDDVKISVTIENSSEQQDIIIRKPLTSSGLLRYNLFSIKKENNETAYAGALFHSDKKALAITLSPKEVSSFNVSIAREYLLDDSGCYSLEIITDALLDNPLNVLVNSHTLSFCLNIGDELPLLTRSQNAEKISKSHIKYKEFGNEHRIYNSWNNKEVNNTQEAHQVAENALKYIIDQSIYYLSFSSPPYLTFPGAFSTSYEEIFCKSNHNDWSNLIDIYTKMYNYTQKGMKYWYRAKECEHGDYGYIFNKDTEKNIYFCDEYVKAQNAPNSIKKYDSKAGVHIHEISHKAAFTKDHFYSYAHCNEKAKLCNPLTIGNADCIQIFAELVYADNDDFAKMTNKFDL